MPVDKLTQDRCNIGLANKLFHMQYQYFMQYQYQFKVREHCLDMIETALRENFAQFNDRYDNIDLFTLVVLNISASGNNTHNDIISNLVL